MDDPSPLNAEKNQKPLTEELAKQAGKIAALLVRDGFLTPKQVEYATRIRSRLESPRTFLEVLKELKYVTDDQINQVIRTSYESINLEDLLLELGLLSEENLRIAQQIQAEEKPPKSLREILVQNNFIGEHKLVQLLSKRLGFPLVELDKSPIDRRFFPRAPSSSMPNTICFPWEPRMERFGSPLRTLWALRAMKKPGDFSERRSSRLWRAYTPSRAFSSISKRSLPPGRVWRSMKPLRSAPWIPLSWRRCKRGM